MEQIIESILDNDLYKFTMGQVIFNQYPTAEVEFQFINRGKTKFIPGIAAELTKQIQYLSNVRMTEDEFNWISKIRYIKLTYAEWLYGFFKLNPNQVQIEEVYNISNGELNLRVKAIGTWRTAMFWEIIILSLISEIHYKMNGIYDLADWDRFADNTEKKAKRLNQSGIKIADFGTRRRFAFKSQDIVVNVFKQYDNFVGTCNPYLAKLHSVTPIGTSAHESVMGMQALHGIRGCNKSWLDSWVKEFNGDLGIALTDTITTDSFLKDFDLKQSTLYNGVRHDSGCPFEFGEKIIQHYKNYRIDPKSKTIVFSDGLNIDKAIEINNYFNGRINVSMGIGTHLSNDFYYKNGNKIDALNIVMKPSRFKFNDKWVDVVKLSDNKCKYTGNEEAIKHALYELNV